MKICRTCNQSLDEDKFKKSKRTKDGLTLDCSECYDNIDRSHNSKPGKYKTGKKLNGKRIKKRGRKTGTLVLKETEIEVEVGTIVNYLTFGKSKIENEQNIKEGLTAGKPMNVGQAVREYGIHPNTFYTHLRTYPAIRQKYDILKQNMREYLKDTAENSMLDILTNGALTDKEKFDASFKVAQATMKEYNPKIEIEKKELKINLNKNSDDLKADLALLLGINLN